jgi:hypothetical protein
MTSFIFQRQKLAAFESQKRAEKERKLISSRFGSSIFIFKLFLLIARATFVTKSQSYDLELQHQRCKNNTTNSIARF